ncbi:MAG: MerR family transcriptional regulator [Streptococcaceae bacterium]|jgi:DNA-binding transcriptional MerR regulator|nr:MerR family transcriptional regulator [Streptococcaceae bacterium]
MKTIKEISDELSVSAYTIRFYEKEGLLNIPRNDRGIRDFDQHSIEVLKALLHYRNAGVALGDIKKMFANYDNHEYVQSLLLETKKELELKMAEMQATMKFLDYKIGLKCELLGMKGSVG